MKKRHDIRIDRSQLHPWLNYKLELLLNKCAKKGIYLIITEGFRTKAYQDALYAKGRTAQGKIVTNAQGSTYSSQHMWGIAFDIAINDKKHTYDVAIIKKVAKIAKGLGLGWGGDWKSIVDTPHFYLKEWGSTTVRLKSMYGTPDNFKETWFKKVSKTKGLTMYKHKTKLGGSYCIIPKGAKVKVLFTKGWYAKIKFNGYIGYVSKKYLK